MGVSEESWTGAKGERTSVDILDVRWQRKVEEAYSGIPL
jgi:hypothetical protein